MSELPGYRLAIAPAAVDSGRFTALVRQAAAARERGDHPAAARVLRDALDVWRGPALVDAQGCLGLETEARSLTEAYVEAAEDWLDAELRCDRAAQVLPAARRLVAEHPLRERLSAQLARCLDRAGRRAEAVRVCSRFASAGWPPTSASMSVTRWLGSSASSPAHGPRTTTRGRCGCRPR